MSTGVGDRALVGSVAYSGIESPRSGGLVSTSAMESRDASPVLSLAELGSSVSRAKSSRHTETPSSSLGKRVHAGSTLPSHPRKRETKLSRDSLDNLINEFWAESPPHVPGIGGGGTRLLSSATSGELGGIFSAADLAGPAMEPVPRPVASTPRASATRWGPASGTWWSDGFVPDGFSLTSARSFQSTSRRHVSVAPEPTPQNKATESGFQTSSGSQGVGACLPPPAAASETAPLDMRDVTAARGGLEATLQQTGDGRGSVESDSEVHNAYRYVDRNSLDCCGRVLYSLCPPFRDTLLESARDEYGLSRWPSGRDVALAARRRVQSVLKGRQAARASVTGGGPFSGRKSRHQSYAALNAVAVQHELHEKRRWWERFVVLPASPFRYKWDVLIIILVVYNAIALPLDAAFDNVVAAHLANLDSLIDGVFVVDMLINSRTAFPSPVTGNLVTGSREMTLNYLRGWFFIDLLSILPFELIGTLMGVQDDRSLRYLAALKCLRLLRLGRLLRYLDHIQFVRTWRLGKLLGLFVLCTHWAACTWHFVAALELAVGRESTWIDRWDLGEASAIQRYVAALYVGLCLLLGENLDPSTAAEQLCAYAFMLLGAVAVASLFGEIAVVLQSANSRDNIYSAKMDAVNATMRLLGLPADLRERIRNYYDFIHRRRHDIDVRGFARDLSGALSDEMQRHVYKDIGRVPLFDGAPRQFMSELLNSVSTLVHLPGDCIVRQGDVGREMYVILAGQVRVRVKGKGVVSHLSKGDYFGELALLFPTKRAATVVADSYTDSAMLGRTALRRLLGHYPEMKERVEEQVRARLVAYEHAAARAQQGGTRQSSRSSASGAVEVGVRGTVPGLRVPKTGTVADESDASAPRAAARVESARGDDEVECLAEAVLAADEGEGDGDGDGLHESRMKSLVKAIIRTQVLVARMQLDGAPGAPGGGPRTARSTVTKGAQL